MPKALEDVSMDLMERHYSLVEALRQTPGDLDLALIYSDFLKDMGREDYGEYIRCKATGSFEKVRFYEWMLPREVLGFKLIRDNFGLVEKVLAPSLEAWCEAGSGLYAALPVRHVEVSDRNPVYVRDDTILQDTQGRQPHVVAVGWWTEKGGDAYRPNSPAYLPPGLFHLLPHEGKVLFKDLEYKQYYIDSPHDWQRDEEERLAAYDLAINELSEACLKYIRNKVLAERA